MTFRAIECDSAAEALQVADASGCGEAVTLGGRYYALYRPEAERLAAAGVEFAFLHDHVMPDGTVRIMTVPVN